MELSCSIANSIDRPKCFASLKRGLLSFLLLSVLLGFVVESADSQVDSAPVNRNFFCPEEWPQSGTSDQIVLGIVRYLETTYSAVDENCSSDRSAAIEDAHSILYPGIILNTDDTYVVLAIRAYSYFSNPKYDGARTLAYRYSEQLCRMEDGMSCLFLGLSKLELEEAAQIDASFMSSLSHAPDDPEKQKNVPEDYDFAAALPYLQNACQAEIPIACALVGSIYRRAKSEALRDAYRAFFYFKNGCVNHSEKNSCAGIRKIYIYHPEIIQRDPDFSGTTLDEFDDFFCGYIEC